MSSHSSVPGDREIRAFFAYDKSANRFFTFLKRFIYPVLVTPKACTAVISAAYSMNTSTLPSPLRDFYMSENVELSKDNPVRSSLDVTQEIVRRRQPNLPAGTMVTFEVVLTRGRQALSISDLDLYAFVAIQATISPTSYRHADGDVCDQCIARSPTLLINDCRSVGADALLENLQIPAPTCTNCFATSATCTWTGANIEDNEG